MGEAFNVSDNIGYDGFSYFCRRCGKAGYQRATQVRSHLAMCPGTLIRKGILPPANNRLQPLNPLSYAGFQNQDNNRLQPLNPTLSQVFDYGQQQQQPLVVAPLYNQVARLEQGMAELQQFRGQMQNEYQHILTQVNQNQESWWKKNIAWIVVLGVMIFAFMASGGGGGCCPCPASGGSGSSLPADRGPTRRGPDMSRLSERIVNKAADTAITKAFGRLF